MNNFKNSIQSGKFVITSEISLTPESNIQEIESQARALGDGIDGILVTDNQAGQLHMSPIVVGSILLNSNIDPIIQLSCRNRNRISLLSDILGCLTLGVSSFSLIRGDKVPEEYQPRPKAIMDINATELISMAQKLKSDEIISPPRNFIIGGVLTPHTPKDGWQAKNLRKKVDSGAQFFFTHTCLDMDLLSAFMKKIGPTKILQQCYIVAGIALLESTENAEWLRKNRPNVIIPNQIMNRLKEAKDQEAEGIKICSEQINTVKKIPGISGVHIIGSKKLENIPLAIRASINLDE
ncbi:MAG: methylenetetrahydrofolate reductase [Gammaproteobacteria bacterium]